MHKIVIRMPNWIGDFVMATPVLEGLKHKYPGCFLAAVCSGASGELLKDNPFVDEVISVSRENRFSPKTKEGKNLIEELKRRKFDLGVLLTNSFSTASIFYRSGIKKRIGFRGKWRRFLLSESYVYPSEDEHLVKTYQRFTGTTFSPRLFIPPAHKEVGKMVIGINPGAAYGSAKCWLPDRFRAVIEELLSIPGVEIRVYGDASGKSVVDEVCNGFDERVVNLAGKTTLYELAKEIALLEAFLTNDSGPMHIAAALKVPLVALFGSTSSEKTGPYEWGEVIHKKVECSPCYQRKCPIDFRCMKAIESKEVTRTLKRQLLIKPLENLSRPFLFQGVKEVTLQKSRDCYHPSEVGIVVLAGGAGRRLGTDFPKGCLKVAGKSLYERFWEKRKGEMVFLTSPATSQKTREHFVEKGIDAETILIRSLPRLTGEYEESPEGNGGIYEALYRSGIFAKWNHLQKIVVVPIDNPLIDPYHEELLSKEEELTVLAIEKKGVDEAVGVLVEKEGGLHVCEYFDLPSEEKEKWKWAFSGVFSAKINFYLEALKTSLPWHEVVKNEKKHLERFALDAFPIAKSYRVAGIDREKYFHPIKTHQDIAPLEKIL